MNRFDEMREALEDADRIQRAADSNALQLADLLAGRLRNVGRQGDYFDHIKGHKLLCQLKKELAEYNMRTGQWKS